MLIKGMNKFDCKVPTDIKLRDSKVYICKTTNGWYRIYRQGQRSWDAVCVVPTDAPEYERNGARTVHGNKSSIVSELESIVTIHEFYMLNNEVEYRKTLMSIVATGDMDKSFNFEIIQEEEL